MSPPETPLLDPPEVKSSPRHSRPRSGPPPVQMPPGQARRVVLRRHLPLRELLGHFALLCLRPEQWAQALKYPVWVSLVTVLLAAFIVAGALGVAQGRVALRVFNDYAARYDQKHPRMQVIGGKLTVESAPGKVLPKFQQPGQTLVIEPDPANLIVLTTETPFFGEKQSWQNTYSLNTMQSFMSQLFGASNNWTIDSAHLTYVAQQYGWLIVSGVGVISFAFLLGAELLWALIIAFLVCPLVMVGAPELHLPRRVAYRVALAVTVPLMIFDGALKLAGFSPVSVFGGEYTPVFWFIMAAVLAFWAGHLANQQFHLTAAKR